MARDISKESPSIYRNLDRFAGLFHALLASPISPLPQPLPFAKSLRAAQGNCATYPVRMPHPSLPGER